MRKTAATAFVLASVLMMGGARADQPPPSPGELRMSMRQAWDDQLTFTRNWIISGLGMHDDQEPVIGYLLQHQDLLADVLEPYYGEQASQQLAALFRAHAQITVDLVQSISAGETGVSIARHHARWYGNVKEIAAYLHTLNPRWDRQQLATNLETYLELTMDEITGRSIRNWDIELAAYERARTQSTRIADLLSNGIIRQHPQRFR